MGGEVGGCVLLSVILLFACSHQTPSGSTACRVPPASPCPSEPGLLAQHGAQAQSLFDATLPRTLDLSDPLLSLPTLLLQ